MSTVHWDVDISEETDRSVQSFLARSGKTQPDDLARFIEEAVQNHIFELTVQQVKAANANISEIEMNSIVDEAVQWARSQR